MGSAAVAGTVWACTAEKTSERADGGIMRGTPHNLPEIRNSILERIGNTSLLQLHSIVPKGHARIWIKLESENPTGSMKDRMALAMVEAAEKDGRLIADR